MNRTPVRVGFVGCGRVAENHYRALARCQLAELVAISDCSVDRLRAKADRWGVEPMGSPEALIASDSIDAVFVLTPTESHFEYTEKAIRSGKHVLVEKPVSYDLREIEQLDRLAKSSDVQCVPGHNYLYLPEISRMVRFVKEQRAGTPFYFFMSEIYRMPEDLVQKYHGPLREVLCHEIYIMLALLGVPKKVQGFSGRFRDVLRDSEEQVILNAEFPNGSLAHLFVSWAGEDETSDPWTFKIKLLGTGGGLHFSRRDAVILHEGLRPEYPLYDEMFEHEVRYFIDDCILGKKEPPSTLQDACVALQVMRAVEDSIQNNTVVEFSGGQEG